MFFPLLFFILLSAIVLSSGWLISKSQLVFIERYFSIIAIFVLFISITILNEYKQPNARLLVNQTEYLNNKISNAIERRFYLPFQNQYNNKFKLPIMNDYLEILEDNMNISEIINNKLPEFWFIKAENNLGLSFSLREYARTLQNNDIPILYINFKEDCIISFQELEIILKINNIKLIEDLAEGLNNKKIIPIIILDGIENTIEEKQDINTFIWKKESIIFDFFVNLFKKKSVKIITITYDYNFEKEFGNKIFLFAQKKNLDYLKRKEINVHKYFFDILNRNLNTMKKFEKDNLINLKFSNNDYILDFQMIADYYNNSNNYLNFNSFYSIYQLNNLKSRFKFDRPLYLYYFNEFLPLILSKKNSKNIIFNEKEIKINFGYLKTEMLKDKNIEFLEKLEDLEVIKYKDNWVILKNISPVKKREIDDLEIKDL